MRVLRLTTFPNFWHTHPLLRPEITLILGMNLRDDREVLLEIIERK